MTPDQAEALPDVMWDAMVRHMQDEAAAIQKTAATQTSARR
jgi:hypothetical protein